MIIKIPTDQIKDWDSFHSVFQSTLGFADFYGRNMDAWVDCMTYIDGPPDEMTRVSVPPGEILALHIDNAPDFQRRCPEQYQALIESVSFVNFRRMERGGTPVLALMRSGWYKSSEKWTAS